MNFVLTVNARAILSRLEIKDNVIDLSWASYDGVGCSGIGCHRIIAWMASARTRNPSLRGNISFGILATSDIISSGFIAALLKSLPNS